MKATFTHCLLIATTAFLITGFSAQHLLNNVPQKTTQVSQQVAPTSESIQEVVIIGTRMTISQKAQFDAEMLATASSQPNTISADKASIAKVIIIGKRMNAIEKAGFDADQKQAKMQWADARVGPTNKLK